MMYLAYVHKDENSAYGLTFPDFPGTFSAADEFDGLPAAAQEAIELHFDGEELELPTPSAPEQWAKDKRFQDGYWMLINIDTKKISSKPMRLNVSLPEYLVAEIDRYADAHHMTRSAFLAAAAEKAMA